MNINIRTMMSNFERHMDDFFGISLLLCYSGLVERIIIIHVRARYAKMSAYLVVNIYFDGRNVACFIHV